MSTDRTDLDFDWGNLAQKAAQDHLDKCFEALEPYDGQEIDPSEIDSPAFAPFCGCETCIVREVLYAAWPVIAAATREGFTVDYE